MEDKVRSFDSTSSPFKSWSQNIYAKQLGINYQPFDLQIHCQYNVDIIRCDTNHFEDFELMDIGGQ